MPPTTFLRKYPIINKPTSRNTSGTLGITLYPLRNGQIAEAVLCRAGKRFQKRLTVLRPSDGKVVWGRKRAIARLQVWLEEIKSKTVRSKVKKLTVTRRCCNRKKK